MTGELPSAALIAEGRCPGWKDTSFVSDDPDNTGYYAADWRQHNANFPPWRGDTCKFKISRGDLCGRHDNERHKGRARVENRLLARARSDEWTARNARLLAALNRHGIGAARQLNRSGLSTVIAADLVEQLIELLER